jgi:hypothetical protein
MLNIYLVSHGVQRNIFKAKILDNIIVCAFILIHLGAVDNILGHPAGFLDAMFGD